MSTSKIIVFGATGGVGSAVVHIAHSLGAKVVIASRDLQKPVPGLSSEEEQARGFERVQADLTKPEALEDAVRKSGAKRAFLCLVHGMKEGMRCALVALKAAGIEFVVFLSSGSVRGDDLTKITLSNPLAFVHAQVELVLRDLFGAEGYVAVRPAYFNSNSQWWAGMLREGDVRLAYAEHKFDWIAPEDVGKAAGVVLVKGFTATEGFEQRNAVFLVGPKFITQRDAAIVLGRALGKEVKVTEVDEDAAAAIMAQNGLPVDKCRWFVHKIGQRYRGEVNDMYDDKTVQEGQANLKRFVGEPTSLEKWAKDHKDLFA